MSAVEFFRQREQQMMELVRVAAIARVDRYDGVRKRADVTPRGMPMIQNALVLDHLTLERGDNVFIVFNDIAFDGSSTERHRIDDAVVVGKVRI